MPYSSLMLFNMVTEEIKLLETEALEIDDNNYVLEAQKAAKTPSHAPSQVTISTINEVVVGLDDEAQTIIDQLTRGSMQLDNVSIVGMPGLGKTTLAKKVYHDPKIMSHFHIRAWCCVSQVYCKKDLLLEILACIVPKNSNEYSKMNENDLAEELYKLLKGSRYAIVLDDVWDIVAWNVLERSFPNDANGSRILLTSRLYEMALLVKPTGKPHPLRQLTDDESWELLQKKLVHKEGYPPALQVLGMQIAKNCNGLPLAVVIIAGILGTLEQEGWEEIAERLSSNIVCGTNQCMSILELSYKHLPSYLKPCLLYFGAFLEDQEIPVWRLTQLWIAEGFVQENELKSIEDTAEDYIMALISRSLVMVAKQRSIGGVKTCYIHDLLHEFCVAKAKEENFLQLVHRYDELFNFDEPPNLHQLCIYSQRKHFVNLRLFYPHIHSLLFSAQGHESYGKIYNFSFVFCLKLLRVLDLGEINLGFLFPSEIAMLVQLRYLSLRGQMKDTHHQ
ncbi:hypothetical protein ACH5RR_021276 [Cinchona calisaya]|uniref:Uncharacterized protein n=1 Tax=Cinchona calisaya TaxID=153742 RepID=A0ABD2ZKN0_9GENT